MKSTRGSAKLSTVRTSTSTRFAGSGGFLQRCARVHRARSFQRHVQAACAPRGPTTRSCEPARCRSPPPRCLAQHEGKGSKQCTIGGDARQRVRVDTMVGADVERHAARRQQLVEHRHLRLEAAGRALDPKAHAPGASAPGMTPSANCSFLASWLSADMLRPFLELRIAACSCLQLLLQVRAGLPASESQVNRVLKDRTASCMPPKRSRVSPFRQAASCSGDSRSTRKPVRPSSTTSEQSGDAPWPGSVCS